MELSICIISLTIQYYIFRRVAVQNNPTSDTNVIYRLRGLGTLEST